MEKKAIEIKESILQAPIASHRIIQSVEHFGHNRKKGTRKKNNPLNNTDFSKEIRWLDKTPKCFERVKITRAMHNI